MDVGNVVYGPQAPHVKGSWLSVPFKWAAAAGTVVGVGYGWAQRISSDPPKFASYRSCINGACDGLCRAGPTNPTMKSINAATQGFIKGPMKYALPLVPIVGIFALPVIKGTYSYIAQRVQAAPAQKRTWCQNVATAMGNQPSIPWQRIAWAVSMCVVAAASAVFLTESLAGFGDLLPSSIRAFWITTLDPSGHILMQLTLACATAIASNAATACKRTWTVGISGAASLAMGVANFIAISHTAHVCHTTFEAVDGFKWAAVVIGTTYVATKVCAVAINWMTAVSKAKTV